MIMQLVDDIAVDDLVRGATFLGTGGGGSPAQGRMLLRSELASGHTCGWVDKERIGDDAWTVCATFMGNRAPLTPEEERKKEELGLSEPPFANNLVGAVHQLENYLGISAEAIVASELGGSNTPGALATGACLGIPVVDGDYAGRALPEIAQMTPCLLGQNILPVAAVDRWGNTAIIKEATSYQLTERMGKMLAMASFGNTGLAFALRGSVMKSAIISGSLTRCYTIGRGIREAGEQSERAVEAITDLCNGWLLYEGEVVRKEWKVLDGCYTGTHSVKGTGDFAGSLLRIWFKNENHLTWLDNKPYVASPDLVSQIDLQSYEPVPNHELREGQMIAVIGIRAHELYRSPKGISLTGPRHYDSDFNYVPIEDRLRS